MNIIFIYIISSVLTIIAYVSLHEPKINNRLKIRMFDHLD